MDKNEQTIALSFKVNDRQIFTKFYQEPDFLKLCINHLNFQVFDTDFIWHCYAIMNYS